MQYGVFRCGHKNITSARRVSVRKALLWFYEEAKKIIFVTCELTDDEGLVLSTFSCHLSWKVLSVSWFMQTLLGIKVWWGMKLLPRCMGYLPERINKKIWGLFEKHILKLLPYKATYNYIISKKIFSKIVI